jgi:hypothetical protein
MYYSRKDFQRFAVELELALSKYLHLKASTDKELLAQR